MKTLVALVALMAVTQLAADEIQHKILPGSLHTGGSLTIRVINERQTEFDAEVKYQIKTRALVPVPSEYKKGTFIATLPIEYLDERGYEELALGGPTVYQGARLEYVGLDDIQSILQTHHVRLTPPDSKWVLEAWYHPSVAATGWVKLALELQVPLIGRYKVFSTIAD